LDRRDEFARAEGIAAANAHEILLKLGRYRRCNDEVAAFRDQRVGRDVIEQTTIDNSLVQLNDRQGKWRQIDAFQDTVHCIAGISHERNSIDEIEVMDGIQPSIHRFSSGSFSRRLASNAKLFGCRPLVHSATGCCGRYADTESRGTLRASPAQIGLRSLDLEP